MANKVKVLVVDDEPSVTDALKLILEDEGYEVVTALSGREGVRRIQEQRFDVTITDLRLPDMTGIDLYHRICEIAPGSPVILITSHSTSTVIAEARGCGMSEFLSKPFLPAEIIDLLTMILSKQTTADRLSLK